jgi:prevent-host-death family protein
MTVSILEDIKTVSELKKQTNRIFQQLHKTGRPIIVTVNGKPDVILMDVEVFERKLKALNLAVLLNEAEDDVRRGRIRPAREFIREFSHAKKIPG